MVNGFSRQRILGVLHFNSKSPGDLCRIREMSPWTCTSPASRNHCTRHIPPGIWKRVRTRGVNSTSVSVEIIPSHDQSGLAWSIDATASSLTDPFWVIIRFNCRGRKFIIDFLLFRLLFPFDLEQTFRVFVRRPCTATVLIRFHRLFARTYYFWGYINGSENSSLLDQKKEMGHGLNNYAPKTLHFSKTQSRIVSMGFFIFCSSFHVVSLLVSTSLLLVGICFRVVVVFRFLIGKGRFFPVFPLSKVTVLFSTMHSSPCFFLFVVSYIFIWVYSVGLLLVGKVLLSGLMDGGFSSFFLPLSFIIIFCLVFMYWRQLHEAVSLVCGQFFFDRKVFYKRRGENDPTYGVEIGGVFTEIRRIFDRWTKIQ